MGEPSTEPFLKQQPFAQKVAGHRETHAKNCLGEHSKEPFARRKSFAAKYPRRQTLHSAPRPGLWLNTPKLTLLGKIAKKRWNLPQNFLAAQDGSAPEDQRHHETCATLVEPVEPFGSQDGPAPENHRESESNSAPKPLLSLKTPKLLLLERGTGKKKKHRDTQIKLREVAPHQKNLQNSYLSPPQG